MDVLSSTIGELSTVNAGEYLKNRGMELGGSHITELGGGVSNTVLLVESDGPTFALKQALGKLRVQEDWFAGRERVFREAAALQRLASHLPEGSLPRVLFEDRENYLFAMTTAPTGSACWKDLLLSGEICVDTACAVGALLGKMASATWRNESWEREFGDQTVFDQLRIDPYYRVAAGRHPDLASHAARLIEETALRRVCLVHGDWSPKNLLVCGAQVMAIDFEVIHFGDPSFDSAFLLNHLLLKSVARPQWRTAYAAAALGFWRTFLSAIPEQSWIEAATLQHLGWLLLARVDGKSPVEYLREPGLRDQVRRFARNLILAPPKSVAGVFGEL
jgi:5-methylthioribose kinase